MARCDCAGGRCSCGVIAGDGIEVTGSGEATNPYIVTAVGLPIAGQLTVEDTASLNLTLTGEGVVNEPYIISGEVVDAGVPDDAVAGLITDPDTDTHSAVQGVADGAVAAMLGEENVWAAAQVFDAVEIFRIGSAVVSVGAADSGGPGFRALVIPN